MFKKEIINKQRDRGNIPAYLGVQIEQTKEREEMLSKERQKLYHSGVGMLLWLSKHTCPDASNAIQESSKVLDKANEGHFFYLLKIINTLSKQKKICINPNLSGGFEIKGYLDSDYAGDRDTRQSVSGFSIFFNRQWLHGIPKPKGASVYL